MIQIQQKNYTMLNNLQKGNQIYAQNWKLRKFIGNIKEYTQNENKTM